MTRPRTSCCAIAVLLLLLGASRGTAAHESTGTLQGTVLRSGEAAPFATVSIEGTALHVQTDSLGRFVLADVPQGARVLDAWRFGDGLVREPVLVHRGLSPRVWIDLARGSEPASESARDTVLVLTTSGAIEGMVRDSAGCAGEATIVSVPDARRIAVVDAQGWYRISGVPPGRWSVWARSLWGGVRIDTVTVTAGQRARHDFLMPGRLDLHLVRAPRLGHEPIVDYAAPHPYIGAYLLVQVGGPCDALEDTVFAPPGALADTLVGKGGWYGLHVWPATRYDLWIHYALRPGVRFVDMRIVDDADVLVADFCGSSRYPDNGEVRWERDYGHYTIPPPGRYRVICETTAGVDELPFCLRWMRLPASVSFTGTIEGAVVDSRGAPLAYANVRLPGAHTGALADTSGHFRVTGVPAGSQAVVCQTAGFASRTLPTTVIAGETTSLRIDMGPALPVRSLHGDVRLQDRPAATNPHR